MKNKKKKGFTLIELLAVVAIILILALIALPSLKGYKERANVSQAVASSKVLVNAVDTYNAAYAGEVGKNGNVADTIKEDYKLSTILEESHTYVDSYISEQEQGKLRKLISNDVTVKDLRTFVSENGTSENIIFKDGKIVLGK
ncbi:prepilin-type N-terminal cleavage/methylation domain-containing protein [Clostridium senegalense]|uniref:prepilin-type N-terminal cleavage/methylation domain-containing protein n=1 Tax=Clostridium senegalense TaxID=1465809 RepID=UPI001C1286A8|nr:prepilin-type N-terminal cleavage/methylation domain-containing protein [Clostridium senegalense]MBU5226041.1 prepilin-type N-terminal cleavage/methylation domain-containing protein [Clostridium senegalense]